MSRCPWALLAVVASIAGCDEQLPEEKPPAPDMSAVIAAYQQPTLSIDASNLGTIAGSTIPIGSTVQQLLAVVSEMGAAISESGKANQETESREPWEPGMQTQGVDGDAFMKVHRICPGWVQGPPDEANGALDLIVGLTEAGVDPIIWGTATACKLGTGSASMQVNGALNLYLGDGVAFDQLETSLKLFQLSLDEVKGGSTEHVETDFRLGGIPERLEYRVFAGDQFAIYFEEAAVRGYRAANGTFSCDFEAKKCSAESGDTLSW